MPFDKQGRWFPDAGGSNYKNFKNQQEQKKKQEEQSQEQDRRRKSAELALAGLEGIKKIISILPRATTTSKPQEPSKPATTPYKPPQPMVQRSWNQQPLEDAGWIGTPKPGTTPVSTQVNGTPQDLKNILGRSALDNMLSKQQKPAEKPIQVPDLYKAMAGTVDQQRDRQQKIGPGKTDAVIPGAAGGGAYSDHLAQSQQAIKDALDKGDSGALSMALFKHEQLRSQIGEQYNKVPTIGPRDLSPWQKTVENTQEFGKNAETFGANAVQGFAESIPGVNALSKAITGHDTNKMAQEYAQYLADLKADPSLGSPMSPEDYFKFEGKMVGASEASDILRRAGVSQGGWAAGGHLTGSVMGTVTGLVGGGGGLVAKGVTTLSKQVLKSSPKWLQSQISGILGAAAAGMTYQAEMEAGQELAHPEERSLKEHVQKVGSTGLYYGAYGVAAPWAEKFMGFARGKLPGPVNNAIKTAEQKTPRLAHVAASTTEGLASGAIVGAGQAAWQVATGHPDKAWDTLTGEAKGEMAENFIQSIAFSLLRRGGTRLPVAALHAPGISEGHDVVESIANRVVNKLNDTDKDDYNEAMKDAEAQGVSRADAHSVLLDELAKTEEGQQQITEAVQEEFDSHVENKVVNAGGQPETAPIQQEQPQGETTTAAPAINSLDDIQGMSMDQLVSHFGSLDAAIEHFGNLANAETDPQKNKELNSFVYDLTDLKMQQEAQATPAPEQSVSPVPPAPAAAPEPVAPQATTAPANRQPVSDPQPGMQVGIAGKGDARFTVVSTDAKGFVKLRSEQGTELPPVHKGNLFTEPQAEPAPASSTPTEAPASTAPTPFGVGDTVQLKNPDWAVTVDKIHDDGSFMATDGDGMTRTFTVDNVSHVLQEADSEDSFDNVDNFSRDQDDSSGLEAAMGMYHSNSTEDAPPTTQEENTEPSKGGYTIPPGKEVSVRNKSGTWVVVRDDGKTTVVKGPNGKEIEVPAGDVGSMRLENGKSIILPVSRDENFDIEAASTVEEDYWDNLTEDEAKDIVAVGVSSTYKNQFQKVVDALNSGVETEAQKVFDMSKSTGFKGTGLDYSLGMGYRNGKQLKTNDVGFTIGVNKFIEGTMTKSAAFKRVVDLYGRAKSKATKDMSITELEMAYAIHGQHLNYWEATGEWFLNGEFVPGGRSNVEKLYEQKLNEKPEQHSAQQPAAADDQKQQQPEPTPKQETADKKFEKLFFAVSPHKDEIEAVNRAKPKSVLLSYARWQGKSLKDAFLDKIGYRPEIILDNGAASGVDVGMWDVFEVFTNEWELSPGAAWNEIQSTKYHEIDGEQDIKEMFPEFVKFVQWLNKNKGNFDYVIAPDSMDASIDVSTRQEMANYAYLFFRAGGMEFIPVFQHGADTAYIDQLIQEGADYIAIGGTRDMAENVRAEYVNSILQKYPQTKFHLLGTNHQRLIDKIPGLYSADGTTWQTASRQGAEGQEARAANGATEMTRREERAGLRPETPPAAKDEGGTTNEPTDRVGTDGERPLGGTPSDDVPSAESIGETGGSAVRGPREQQGRGDGAVGTGDGSADSMGSDSGNVDSSTGRGNNADAGDRSDGMGTKRSSVTERSTNYVITEDADLGFKGAITSARKNIEAIGLMKQIVAEGRPATDEEKQTLAQYIGWGGIKQLFEPEWKVKDDFKPLQAELKQLLTDEEWRAADDSADNAHYTSIPVIRAMYDGIKALGFDGGKILEPSMGAGHFLGAMPRELSKATRATGVEKDYITGNIAKLLYPQSDVRVMGFEDAKMADDFYDVAIGNVPFGSDGIADAHYKGTPVYKASIHNYFFGKALDKVRPGGVVAFITSRYTLDSTDTKFRRYLSSQADLAGAIRLPNTAFKANANTEVVTDILILQKRPENTAPADASWVDTNEMKVEGTMNRYQVNNYFHDHPENVLGELRVRTNGMYGRNELTVTPTHEDLGQAIREAFATLPQNIIPKREKKGTEDAEPRELIAAPGHIKENAYHVSDDGKLYVKRNDNLEPADVPKATAERIKAMVGIRNAVREYLGLQLQDNATEKQLQASRDRLNKVYDAFVKKHDYLNKSVNAKAYMDDPDAYLLLSLENWDKDTQTATKADIFSKRTISRYKPAEKAGTSKEALVITLNEKGYVDLDHMARLTGKPLNDVINDLDGIIYDDPQKGWVTEDEYLSGNVRAKLVVAENAAALDPSYQKNVDALTEVQPTDLLKEEIDVNLGSPWIPTEHIQGFLANLSGYPAHHFKVSYNNAISTWTVDVPDKTMRNRVRSSTGVSVRWATNKYDALAFVEMALNSKDPKVTYTVKTLDGTKTRTDKKATLAAKEKMKQVKAEFTRWLWEDDARSADLAKLYNNKFNTERLREFDGDHLTFPGMSPVWQNGEKTLKKHQKAAIWRAVQNGNTLFAHAVGAGKTAEMIASMMEMKRLGIVNKPMWIVPNHLVAQSGAAFLDMYPAANILVAGKKDFESKNRKRLFAKIATGNFDAVIVAHSSFGHVPMSEDVIASFYEEQIRQLTDAIEQEAVEGKRKASRLGSKLRSARKKLVTKMNAEMQKVAKDDNVTFEELGIDGIVLDEAHEFKNLFYSTKLENVAGLGTADGSGKAFDLYMKVRYLQRLNGGRGIVFATGTPVSNSLVEMYTFQRYLQSDELELRGISSFDSWVQQFGAVKSVMELKPEGKGLRQRTRLAEIFNLPELLQLFRGFADVKTADELLAKGLIARPDLAGGKRDTVEIQPSMELLSFVEELARRAEAIRDGKVTQEEDNMLAIVDAGRKAALDMRLIDPNLPDDPNSKVNVAASKVAETYKNTKKFTTKSGKTIENGTQLVFLDLSTPKPEKTNKNGDTVQDDVPIDDVMASVYQDLRKKLIKNGVDPKHIAFIHDYPKDEQKEELFRKVNNGEIRILMGSTAKMGAGMNVQKRLTDLWHVDVPYRPMDVEQREGRILRQGNMNDEVGVHAMITKRSFDAYMWQLIAAKARVVDQVMTGNLKARRVSDPSGMEMSANEIKAQATDDDRIIKLAELEQEVAVLDNLRQSAIDQLRYMRADYARRAPRFKDAQAHIKKWEADLAQRQDTTGDKFTVKIGNETFTDRAQAAEKLFAIGKDLFAKKEMQKAEKIGEFAGFPLLVEMAQNKDTNQYYVTFILEGQTDHTFGLTETATGLLSSMERSVASFDRHVKQQQDAIADESKQLGKFSSEENRLIEENNRLNLEFNKFTEEKTQLEQELGVDRTSDDDEIQDGETDGSDDDYGDDTLDYSAPDEGDNEDSTLGLAAPIKKSKIQAAASFIQHTDKVLTPNTALQLAEMLTKHLETIMDKGHISRRKALGQFNYQSNEGRVRSEHFGNWRVIGHEIGHAFDKHKGYVGDDLELRAMWQALYPNPAKTMSVSTQIKEGFAEFFQQWVVDPDLARQNAPLTSQMFEDKILADPKLNKIFNKIRTIVDADLGDNALGRAVAGSVVKDFSDDGTIMGDSYLVDGGEGLANYAVGKLRRAIFEFADSLIPARDMAKAAKAQGYENPEYLVKLLSLAGDAQAKALGAFQAPVRDAEGRFLSGKSLEDQYQEIVTKIGEAIGWKTVKLKTVDKEIKILNRSIYKRYKKMGALEIAGAILVARRVQERRGKGFETLPMTEDMANEIMSIANQRFPEAVKAAEEFTRDLSNVILEKLERADILTPEVRQRIEDGSDFYIPFFYDEKKATFTSGSKNGGQTYSQVAKKFRGKFMPVLDPLQAVMLKLTQVEQAVEQKRIITEIMNLAKHEGMAPFASIIPISKVATKIDIGETMASIAKLVGITDQTQFGQDFITLSDAMQGAEMKMWSQDAYKTINGEPVLLNWVDGKPVAIKIAPDILRMIQSMKPVQLNAFFKGLAWTSRKFRQTALLTPTYLKNALTRDVVTGIIQSKNNIGAMATQSAKTLGIMAGAYVNHRGLDSQWSDYQEAQYQLFVSSGGASAAAENMLRGMTGKLYDRDMIATKAPGWFKATGKGTKKVLVRAISSPSDALRFLEEAPRVTEFVSTLKKQFKRLHNEREKAGLPVWSESPDQLYETFVREGTDALPQALQDEMERILVEATYNSAEVTTNFRLHGANKVVREYLPTVSFLHGTIQGTMRMARQIKQKPGPTFAYSTLMVGGLSALSWALMMANDDDRKWYQDLPSNMRDRYWWFPMGNGLYYTIAKPFDYAMLANWGERFLDWQSENPNLPPFLQHEREPNSRTWTSNVASLASTVTGTDVWSNTITTVMHMWANKNNLGGDIVPFGETADMFPWRQYNSSNSLTAHGVAEFYARLASNGDGFGILGGAVNAIADGKLGPAGSSGFSPRMVDYFAQSMFGKWGDWTLKFSDWLFYAKAQGPIDRQRKAGPEYNFYYGALVYGTAEGGSPRTIEKFYDDYTNTIKLMGTVTDLLKTEDTKRAAQYATDENIKMLALYPGMKSIADYLSNANKEIDAVMGDKATTADQRHQKTIQRNYLRRLAAGIIYGQTPALPENSGMTQADADAILAEIMWNVDKKTARERKKAGGASDLVEALVQLKGTR